MQLTVTLYVGCAEKCVHRRVEESNDVTGLSRQFVGHFGAVLLPGLLCKWHAFLEFIADDNGVYFLAGMAGYAHSTQNQNSVNNRLKLFLTELWATFLNYENFRHLIEHCSPEFETEFIN